MSEAPVFPSICDVLPSAAAALGVAQAPDPLGLRDRSDGIRRVVVLLIDGMGWQLLERMAPHAPLVAAALRGELGSLTEARCTFPSTTPTSLVSLGTGVPPGEHGILGFTVAVPGTDRVLTHILWRDDPPPPQWASAPTWFERASADGIDARVVLPAAFRSGGLTYAAYRGARYCAVDHDEDYADRLATEIAVGPGLVFGYTPLLDTAAHQHGIASPEWAQAAAAVDSLLTRVIETLPPDAVLLVTADHGGLDVPAAGRVDVDTDARLASGVRVLAGEPRVRYVHTIEGARDDVHAAWSTVLGPVARVLTRDEAVADGLFGAVRPEHLARIGDLVVICAGTNVVLATRRDPPEWTELVGFHGALDPAEMAIPLLTVRG